MNTNITALLKKASKAPPPSRGQLSSYRAFLPVVETLLNRGFTVKAAVRWLQAQKEIEDGEAALHRAYCAIRQAIRRREANA